MKVGTRTVKKEEITYPSPSNPRLAGLSAEDPAVQGLAASIKKHGLLTRPLLRHTEEGAYDPIDGDRRLIAIFDILGWEEVDADIWQVTDREAERMRLIANVDREDLSSWEKGSYLWSFITHQMSEEGKTPIERYWNQRDIRGEYIRRIADDLAKSVGFVSGNLTIYIDTPEQYRKWIARNREEVKEGKISGRTVSDLITIGGKIDNVEGAFKFYFEPEPKRDLKAADMDIIKKAIRDGQIANIKQLKDFYKEELTNWDRIELFLRKPTIAEASQLAGKLGVRMSEIISASIHLASGHADELEQTVRGL